MDDLGDLHMGRSWPNMKPELEEGCPCPKQACGLVAWSEIDQGCPQHSFAAAKTMRQFHRPEECPALPECTCCGDGCDCGCICACEKHRPTCTCDGTCTFVSAEEFAAFTNAPA